MDNPVFLHVDLDSVLAEMKRQHYPELTDEQKQVLSEGIKAQRQYLTGIETMQLHTCMVLGMAALETNFPGWNPKAKTEAEPPTK